jgi:putative ATP-dependent endonuclease of OLD family
MDPTYHALLIEEPESHLHPQLQRTFFDYINKLNEPNIQLFVTSHSPTLTASVDLDSLIVLKKNGEISSTFTAVKSNLKETDKKYLKKFIDVTRNQLFFANGVLLVEGISEELLIGIFAEIMEIEEKIPDKYNLHKHGIEVINVNGVAFNHYAPLFNSDIPENSLNVRAAIITDDDKGTKAPSKRSELAGNKLKVMEGDHTFEYELYKYEKNRPILNIVLGKVIAKYPQELSELLLEAGDNALCFKDFIAKKDCKADFALALSIYLEDDDKAKETFHVPDYIQDAIKWVIIGDGHL